jgi:septal ring factor EnvC (AmiA/AmiB activator)
MKQNSLSLFLPYLTIVFAMLVVNTSFAQSAKQQELKARQDLLQKEIQQINKLFFEVKQESRSVLERLENVDQKINALERLVRVTNQQANLYSREIESNLKSISKLRSDLSSLKEDYAKMIKRSYRSKSDQSRIMFLLSSQDFMQAYKRLQYMKQYTKHRKKQGMEISAKTEELQLINIQLKDQRKEKEDLIVENKATAAQLISEKQTQQNLIATLKQDENKYVSEIKTKQKESDRIDREIEKLVAAAIAASNKKAGKSTKSTTFALTPEDKIIAGNFIANKGRLPWPVQKGYITMRYGTQQHPVVKSTTIRSNGIRIASEEGAKVRSVFDGEVLAVQLVKNSNPKVLIRHGNYITTYGNLKRVYVNVGDKVKARQEIGEVFTSRRSGKTELRFGVFQDSKIMDPSPWLVAK